MEGIGYGLLAVVVLFAVSYLYLKIKEKAKKNIFFKEQYEMQKNLTENAYVFTYQGTTEQLKSAIKSRIPVDNSFSANFVGGNYTITSETSDEITFLHGAKITTGGGGDEFTATIKFSQTENASRAVAQIIRWKVHDGVTRKAGIQAMQAFFNSVSLAVKDVDANSSVNIVK